MKASELRSKETAELQTELESAESTIQSAYAACNSAAFQYQPAIESTSRHRSCTHSNG